VIEPSLFDPWWGLGERGLSLERTVAVGAALLCAVLGSIALRGAPEGLLLYAAPEPAVGPLARTVPALLICGLVPGWAIGRRLRAGVLAEARR
jgi:hypothetical protein